MGFSRRAVLSGTAAIATLGLGAGRLRAAEFEFKCGTNLAADHPLSSRLQEASDAIRKDTDGRFVLQVFPNNQLGGDSDMLSQLRSGSLELFAVSGVGVLSTLIPKSSIYGVGFAFPDSAAVWRAMDGQLGGLLRKQIEDAGLVVMERIWASGFRQMTTATKPINKPSDLSGLKMRVPVSALYRSIIASLGASPTAINLSEVYSALQARIVDGQENPLVTIWSAKFYEVQKYCAMTNHMWDGYWLVGNKRAWDRVPADLRAVVSRRLDEGALLERADVDRLGTTVRGQLEASGMTFTEPDRAAFRSTLAQSGFYRDWKARYGDQLWDALEQTAGTLG